MKRILSLLLSAVMLLSMLPVPALAEESIQTEESINITDPAAEQTNRQNP